MIAWHRVENSPPTWILGERFGDDAITKGLAKVRKTATGYEWNTADSSGWRTANGCQDAMIAAERRLEAASGIAA